MNKKVLLARPSLFIVNEMKPFIELTGYEPRPLRNLEILDKISQEQVAGTVISTAINSDVKESMEEVISRIRSRFPNMPVVLATLVDFEHLIKALRLKESAFGNPVNFLDLQRAENKLTLDSKREVLVLHKSDIDTDEKRKSAASVVKRFFY